MDYTKAADQLYGGKNMPMRNQATYWYITAEWIPKDGFGRPKAPKSVLLGPYPSEDVASTTGMDRLGNIMFEVIELPTRDRGKATQLLRARKLNSGSGLDNALRRVGHK